MNNWDPKQHLRDPNNGQFTESWASGALGQMGLLDPEVMAAQTRQNQWVADTLDAVEGVLGEPGQNPYWMEDHHQHLQNLLKTVPLGFEQDPRVSQARQKVATSSFAEDAPLLPWDRSAGAVTEGQKMAAFPYWRSEVARLLRRQGYDIDLVQEHFRQADLLHLMTDEAGYREFNHIDPPRLMVKFIAQKLGRHDGDLTHLQTADVVYDKRAEGEHGGKELKADDLDVHSDFATSGEYEIWLDGAWHQLEEVYHDNPDEEEIEVLAGDQQLMIDTSDDIELRRIPQPPRRRTWWE